MTSRTEAVRDALQLILQETALGLGDFSTAFEIVRGAIGVPPQDWTKVPPVGREHPEYAFATLQVLLDQGLIVAALWVDGALERGDSAHSTSWLLERMRTMFDAVPTDRPLLLGDVADFAITPSGGEAVETHNEFFETAVGEVEREWVKLDRRLGLLRPGDH